jgi:glutamate-1-semialdehyde 2,1-aminomutase
VDAVSHVEQVGTRLQQIWREAAERHGLSIQLHGIPCHPGFAFNVDDPLPVTTLFTAEMLRRGVMAKPDVFPSYAHKSHPLEAYASALDATFSVIAAGIQNGDVEKRIGGPVCRPGFKRRTTSAAK